MTSSSASVLTLPPPWPSLEALVAEITLYVLHTRSECQCSSFGDCTIASGEILKRWEDRVVGRASTPEGCRS